MKRHKEQATAKSQSTNESVQIAQSKVASVNQNNQKVSNKRRKIGTNVHDIFESVHEAITTGPTFPLVLSPRSLFEMLCSVHKDVYPNMLADKMISSVTESLPATK
jgi:hypothetical protein